MCWNRRYNSWKEEASLFFRLSPYSALAQISGNVRTSESAAIYASASRVFTLVIEKKKLFDIYVDAAGVSSMMNPKESKPVRIQL